MLTARIYGAIFLLSSLQANMAQAQDKKPLWELGIGLGDLFLPGYRGSDQYGHHVIPFPYLVYRGEFIKSDRNGIRGNIFDNERIEFNISIGASLPVSSDNNDARRDMPNLDPTFAIGPSVNLKLWRTDDRHYSLDLRLPLRTVVAVGDTIDDAGWEFSPRFNLDIADVADFTGWNLGILAGPIYGSKRNHEYFYSVLPQYANVDRPAYAAQGGYAGSQLTMALSKRYQDYWLGAFVRFDNLKGAVFEDSPLVKDSSYVAVGIGIAWIFSKSSHMVNTTE